MGSTGREAGRLRLVGHSVHKTLCRSLLAGSLGSGLCFCMVHLFSFVG